MISAQVIRVSLEYFLDQIDPEHIAALAGAQLPMLEIKLDLVEGGNEETGKPAPRFNPVIGSQPNGPN